MSKRGKVDSVPEEKTITLPTATIDSLLQNIVKGQAVAVGFKSEFIKEFKIDGKSLLEWRSHFAIEIPPDLDPERCKQVDLQLLEKLDQAFYYLVISEAVLTALQDGLSSNSKERYEAMIQQYAAKTGKRPSGAMLSEFRKQAEDPSLSTSVANAKITRDFFKSIIDHLTACRKIVDNASMANGTIAKLTQSAY